MSNRTAEELRWAMAIEGSTFGVWDLDLGNETVHYSPQWKTRLGFPRVATPDESAFWRCRVHPDDLAPMLAALCSHVDGSAPTYEARFRLRSNGAGYRTMLSQGRVVERDAAGRALRMVGTMVDLGGRSAWAAHAGLVSEPPEAASPPPRRPFHALLAADANDPGHERGRLIDLVGDLLEVALHRPSL